MHSSLLKLNNDERHRLVEPFAQFPAVMALAGDRLGGWRHGLDAALCDLAIMHVSGRREQDAIDKNTGRPLWSRAAWEPGVASAFGAADTI